LSTGVAAAVAADDRPGTAIGLHFFHFFFFNFRKISTTVSQHSALASVYVCMLFFLFPFFVQQCGTGDQLASEMNMFSAAAGALYARVMNVIYTHRQYRYDMCM
jgi:membrane protein YdbS with pleckstrin-like domain